MECSKLHQGMASAMPFLLEMARSIADTDPERQANKGAVEKAPIRLDAFNFDQTLTGLAKADPDRALWLAQSLERKELNVLANLPSVE